MRHFFQLSGGNRRGAAGAVAVLTAAASVFLVSGMMAVGATPARAAAPAAQDAAGPKFGSVDIGKLLNDSKARQAAGTELTQMRQRYLEVLRRLDQSSARFLSEAEINELAGLYEKPTPTEDEKKRIGVLEQKGDTASGQLTRLQNLPKPEQAEAQQMSQLTDAQQKGDQLFRKVMDGFDQKLKDRGRDIDQKILLEIRAAVAKIAQQKGLAAVFTGDIAVYTPNDITEDVLKLLNAGK